MFGISIKVGRVKKGLTQEQLAAKIGVSKGCVGNWENEKHYPGILEIVKLKKILGLNVDEILEKMIEKESEVADEVENIY